MAGDHELDCESQRIHEKNMDEVVLRGRDPALLLSDIDNQGKVTQKSVKQWGGELFEQMQEVALLLDDAYKCTKYRESITRELAKISDSNLTS